MHTLITINLFIAVFLLCSACQQLSDDISLLILRNCNADLNYKKEAVNALRNEKFIISFKQQNRYSTYINKYATIGKESKIFSQQLKFDGNFIEFERVFGCESFRINAEMCLIGDTVNCSKIVKEDIQGKTHYYLSNQTSCKRLLWHVEFIIVQPSNQIKSQTKLPPSIPIALRQNPKYFQSPIHEFSNHSLLSQLAISTLLLRIQPTTPWLFLRRAAVGMNLFYSLISFVSQTLNARI